jgi:hypothetical protein
MRQLIFPAAMSALLLFTAAAQTPAPKLDRVIGAITQINPGAKEITVKSDAGTVVTATLDEKTFYLRVPPGEKDLKKAARISLDDVAVGDRAYVRGHFSEDQKSIAAAAVIIMTRAELAQRQEHEREEWKSRGLAGPVTAVNPDTKEITITTRSHGVSAPVVIEAGDRVDFRRYSPDSIRFSDAKPSSFADVKVGDQMRVLGDKNADGTRIKAEAIVFGTFRNIAGVIKSIDASTNEITLTDLVAHKPVTVRVTSDTLMRRLPQGLAMMLAQRLHPGQGGAGTAAAGTHPAAAEGAPAAARPEAGKAGGGGMQRGNMDFQDMLERLPPMSVADLKVGDAVMLSGGDGADPSRVTAINLLAGVEPLLTAAPRGGQEIFGSWNFDTAGPQEQ